jgi:transcriptional regulator with PAS, ATPase and Fis domain
MMSIHLPPLRERLVDLPALVAHLLLALGSTADVISDEVMDMLLNYPWPGNIRELKNMLERALLLTPQGAKLRAAHFSCLVNNRPHQPSLHKLTVQEVEKAHIKTVLEQSEGNIDKAARSLNISRATLYRKLKLFSP